MRAGGGKAKGSAFEREICKRLSLWVSHGKKTDLFWRTAMSGGRSTVAHRKGVNVRQAGDICAVAPEGHDLTEVYYFECKAVRDCGLDTWLIHDKGPIRKWLTEARRQARRQGASPILIIKQNKWPVIVVTYSGEFSHMTKALCEVGPRGCSVYRFEDLMKGRYR